VKIYRILNPNVVQFIADNKHFLSYTGPSKLFLESKKYDLWEQVIH